MNTSSYPVSLHEEEGIFLVAARDLPEVTTSGVSVEDALAHAADAIEVVVMHRIDEGEEVPVPSKARKGDILVPLPAALAAKVAVHRLWKTAGISKAEFARRIGKKETEAHRILDPKHGTKIQHLDEAARALGGRLTVSYETL